MADEFKLTPAGPMYPNFPDETSVWLACIGADHGGALHLRLSKLTYSRISHASWVELRRVMDNACRELLMLQDAMSFELWRFGASASVGITILCGEVSFEVGHEIPSEVEGTFRALAWGIVHKAEERLGIVCGVQVVIDDLSPLRCVAIENSNYRPHEDEWRIDSKLASR